MREDQHDHRDGQGNVQVEPEIENVAIALLVDEPEVELLLLLYEQQLVGRLLRQGSIKRVELGGSDYYTGTAPVPRENAEP